MAAGAVVRVSAWNQSYSGHVLSSSDIVAPSVQGKEPLGWSEGMISIEQLRMLRDLDIRSIDKSTLIDLRGVCIDPDLPVEEKIRKFVEQTKNPYAFLIGDYAVKWEYASTERSAEDAMDGYLNHLWNE